MKVGPVVESPSVDMSLDIEALPSKPTTEHGPISVHVEWEAHAEVPHVEVGAGQPVQIDTSAEAQSGLKVEQMDESEIFSCKDDSMVEIEGLWEGRIKEMEGLWEGLIKEMDAQWESCRQQQQQQKRADSVSAETTGVVQANIAASSPVVAAALSDEDLKRHTPEQAEVQSAEAAPSTALQRDVPSAPTTEATDIQKKQTATTYTTEDKHAAANVVAPEPEQTQQVTEEAAHTEV